MGKRKCHMIQETILFVVIAEYLAAFSRVSP